MKKARPVGRAFLFYLLVGYKKLFSRTQWAVILRPYIIISNELTS